MGLSFETRLTEHYGALSETLRHAADFVADHPVDIATRPLRQVSRDSGVSAAAFSRLSRALAYSGFEELREEFRAKIGERVNKFADRAQRLQRDHAGGRDSFLDAHLAACQANLQTLADNLDRDQLNDAVARIAAARRVLLLGALGSTAVIEYLSYMANFCFENWSMAGRMGASIGAGITGLDARDVMIVVTKPPFSDRAINAARLARHRGVHVVVITDSYTCPALEFASSGFLVPTDSPHFYSSYVATMFLVETLIGMLVGQSGDRARRRIAEVEEANRTLAEVRDA